MLLQPFLRPMIAGPCPAILLTKPAPGTGASLLIGTGIMVGHGVDAPKTKTQSRDEAEIKKSITATFLSGDPYLWIDNINHKIDSADFASLLTQPVWADRILGASKQVDFPIRLQTIFSGNNPTGTHEIMRRFLPIRLDAKRNPLRRTFKIDDLNAYVLKRRGELIGAVLTLVNNWLTMGQPDFSGKPLASYEVYSRIVGGVLEAAGIPGFLGNLHLTLGNADDETRGWEAFAQEWAAQKGVGDVAKPAKVPELAVLYVGMQDMPDLGFAPNDNEQVVGTRLSRALQKKVDAILNVFVDDQEIEVKLTREQDKKTRSWSYFLEMVDG